MSSASETPGLPISETPGNNASDISTNAIEASPTTASNQTSPTQQSIFEEKQKLFNTGLDEVMKTVRTPVFVAIGLDIELNQPLIHSQGSPYGVAKLLAHALRKIKAHIAEELDA